MQKEIVKQLVEANATPAYVFDVDNLREKVAQIRESLAHNPQIQLCYAMKANPFLLQPLDCFVDKFEVCSPGELSICKEMNIDMSKVVLSGVVKEKQDIEQALQWGVKTFTIESLRHLDYIFECVKAAGENVNILLRLTSGNQFGMDRDVVEHIIEHRHEYPCLSIEGIQYYSGTQKKSKKILDEIQELHALCTEIEHKFQFKIKTLEYGPGLCVEYYSKTDEKEYLDQCKEALLSLSDKMQLTIEMGRFLVADCGSYITSVMDIKENAGQVYCLVDGGINHVNYYGQVMGARIPPMRFYHQVTEGFVEQPINGVQSDRKICICGSLCTVADVLARNIGIEKIERGDVFVFEKIGAYSVTEGIYLFLSRSMPRIYLYDKGDLKLVRDVIETYQMNQGSR